VKLSEAEGAAEELPRKISASHPSMMEVPIAKGGWISTEESLDDHANNIGSLELN
jgi:hypothetical protein